MCSVSACAKNATDAGVQIQEDQFGLLADNTTGATHSVRRFTWRNRNNITVQVITYGATITSIKVPDKRGTIEDVVMGFDDLRGKLRQVNPHGTIKTNLHLSTLYTHDVWSTVLLNVIPH